jgi:hypothetical protein
MHRLSYLILSPVAVTLARVLGLESGRLVYDLEADEVNDPHPGPLVEPADVCALLAP